MDLRQIILLFNSIIIRSNKIFWKKTIKKLFIYFQIFRWDTLFPETRLWPIYWDVFVNDHVIFHLVQPWGLSARKPFLSSPMTAIYSPHRWMLPASTNWLHVLLDMLRIPFPSLLIPALAPPLLARIEEMEKELQMIKTFSYLFVNRFK